MIARYRWIALLVTVLLLCGAAVLSGAQNAVAQLPSQTVDDAIQEQSPLLYYRFDEASGDVVNYGSANNADGVVTGSTYQTDGLLDTADAITLNGAAHSVYIPYDRSWAHETTFEFGYVIRMYRQGSVKNPLIMGRDIGQLVSVRYANNSNVDIDPWIHCGVRDLTHSYADMVGSTTYDLPIESTWVFLSFTYDDSTERRCRMYLNGVETTYFHEEEFLIFNNEFTWEQMQTDQILQHNTAGLYLGNNQLSARNLHADYDTFYLLDHIMSRAERRALAAALGLQ
jgi:hypothetical protein